MPHRFIAFHTMVRGSGKPSCVVNCALDLAQKDAKVAVIDGLMYEQGALTHQFYEILGSSPVLNDGKNLYDLIRDYEILYSAKGNSLTAPDEHLARRLSFPVTLKFGKRLVPDVLGRLTRIPGYKNISYLPGNNGDVVEIRERINFSDLFDNRSGYGFFEYVKQQLLDNYDYVLLNAPAGHQEISGILCGQLADLILAIDLDTPDTESSPSFDVCVQLANRIKAEEHRTLAVASIKGQNQAQILEAILQNGASD